MNKNLFKVIFNKKRGQMMAVAENTVRDGKSTADTTAASSRVITSAAVKLAGIPVLVFSILVGFGLCTLIVNPSRAEVVHADPSAPKNQQPTILQTANGTPQINIQTPSKAGVSINQYRQLDVSNKGAILNNSRKNAQSRLAGWIQGNPWLANGEARVIVNQINSTNPSQLNGYIEVAGKRAEVIMANPAGINISGSGFINAAGVTLTTGKPVINNGNVNGYEVRGGNINISGSGLDSSGTEYTRILAQAAQINAGIWANNLNITTGNNDIDTAGIVTTNLPASAENKPAVAIDTSNLGGMYAGKIVLVSTDKGVGINNAGQIFAGTGNITINADGRLMNSGSIVAADKNNSGSDVSTATINSDEITNSGTLSSQGRMQLRSRQLNNSGILTTADELNIRQQALINQGEINAGRIDVIADNVHNLNGKIIQTGKQVLNLNSNKLENRNNGLIGYAPANANQPHKPDLTEPSNQPNPTESTTTIKPPTTAVGDGQTETVTNPVSKTEFATGQIISSQEVINDNGQIIANGGIELVAKAGLRNHGTLNLNNLSVNGEEFNNQQGKLTAGKAIINTDIIDNREGEMTTNELLSARSNRLDNRKGKLQSAGSIEISSAQLNNSEEGLIAAQNQLDIQSEDFNNSLKGKIQAGKTLNVKAGNLNNQQGSMDSNILNLSADYVDNSLGAIRTNDNLKAQINRNLNNQNGTFGSGADLLLDSESESLLAVDNSAGGKIIAGKQAKLNTASLNNSKGSIDSDILDLKAERIDNSEGAIRTNKQLKAQIKEELKNRNGLIGSSEKLLLNAEGESKLALDNSEQGKIIAGKQAVIHTATVDNNSGSIDADSLELSADSVNNEGGAIRVNQQLKAQINRNLNNQNGTFGSGADLLLDSESESLLAVDNSAGGKIIAGKQAKLNTASLNNSKGSIDSDSLDLKAVRINNSEGAIRTNKQLKAQIKEELKNRNGLIGSSEELLLNAEGESKLALDNGEQGKIIAGKQAVIHTATVNNNSGSIDADSLELSADSVNNEGGAIRVNQQLKAQINRNLNNQNGTFGSGADLLLDSESESLLAVDNSAGGKIIAGKQAKLNTASLNNSKGSIDSDILDLKAERIDNSEGAIRTNKQLKAQIKEELKNRNGLIGSSEKLLLNAEGESKLALDNSEQGKIIAGKQAVIHTATVDNNSGSIDADSLELSADSVNNEGGAIRVNQQLKAQINRNLNNQNGTFGSGADLLLDSESESLLAVDNSAGGKIIAGKQAKLNTASLNNSKGSIDSDSLDLKAVRINNSEGAIRTNKQLKAQIKEELKNRNGLIGSSEELLLNAEGESKLALDNGEQGKIIAGKQAVIHTATVDNNSGSIDTDSLDLIADSVKNTAGAIRTNKLLRAQINQLLLNQNGQISSAENIDIHDNHKNTLGVDNTNNGQILAGNDLSLQAKNLSHSGVMASGHDAVIYLSENSDINADISANANLKLHSDGKITNSHSLTGGDSVIVEASQIENQTGGSIQSNRQTELSAVDNIINRGLINSNGLTLIQAGNTVDNVGTGRIYGNHVAIGTSNLFNREETKGNETKAAVIAARERLDIGAINIVNKEEGLITSEGDIGIGGKLDARLQATGMANSLINSSARIEAKGNGSIAVNDLRNFNNHFALEEYLASKQHIQQYKFPKLTDFLTEGIDGHFDERKRHNEHAIFIYNDGHYIRDKKQRIIWTDFTRSTYKQRVKESKPGEIIVGGDLNISGQYWENNNSKILVGENLLGSENIQLNNIESKGKQTIIDDGWIGGFKNSHKKYKRKNTGKINNHSITDTDLEQPVSIIQQHVNISINQKKADSADFNKRQIDNSGSKNSGEESKNQLNYNQQKTASDNGLLSENKSTGSINNIQGNNQQQVNNSNEQADLPKFKTINSFNNQLPNNSLYHVDPNNKGYLVETDPAFTNMRKWLGSDYMLNSLGQDPEKMQKRLGDGYYEQRLINEQIAKLTGFRRLNGYYDDEDEFKALMDSGISVAKKLGLLPGVALTADQIARLTSDIVWLVDQTITLPDGTQQTVLVPQVYLMVRDGDLNTSGALISAANIRLHTNKDINNQGTIAGRKIVDLGANNFDNSGLISGQKVGLEANNNINIIGGTVQAQDLLSLQAKHIDINTTTVTHGDERNGGTVINRVAGLYVTGNNNGIMAVNGIEGLNINGANIVNTSTNGLSQLASSKGNVNLGTVQTASHIGYGALNAKNHLALDHADELGTQFMVTNDAQIVAGNQVNVRQADINSNNGNISIYGKEGVNITEGRKLVDMDESYYSKSKKFLSTKKSIDKYQLHQDEAVASNITAKNVNIGTEKDLNIRGSNIISDNQTLLQAGHDINVEAAVNQYQKNEYHARKKSGLMSSGGLGFTIGSLKETDDTKNKSIQHSKTTIGSLNGDTIIVSGGHYTQSGSIVSSPKGNITIAAKQIDVLAAQDQYSTDNVHTLKQSGLTLALNVPAISMLQKEETAIARVGQSKNSRVNAMAAANVGMDLYDGYNLMSEIAKDPKQSVQNISVSLTYGQQKNKSESHMENKTAAASKILAGGQVNLLATGGGKDSNINIIGSDVSGNRGTYLEADNDINLLAAQQTSQQTSKNKSSGWNAGVAANYGSNGFSLGVTAGANLGKGSSKGNEITYRNTHVGSVSGNTIIKSAGATNLTGAQVIGKGVKVDAAELNIESLQDQAEFNSKQQNVSGQVTVGNGVSGSANYNRSKLKSDYASVTEQSGIIAGDNGYQIKVKGNTDLKGGIITSNKVAEINDKNSIITGSITSSDIRNHSKYKGSSIGFSGVGNLNFNNQNPVSEKNDDQLNSNINNNSESNNKNEKNISTIQKSGNGIIGSGKDDNNDKGITKSGINTTNIIITDEETQKRLTGQNAADTIAAIHTNRNSEDYAANAGYLKNNFNPEKVLNELNLQVEVTKEFRENSFKKVNSYIDEKQALLRKQIKETTNEDDKTKLYDEIYQLQYARNLIETVINIVSANPNVAITKGTLQLAQTRLRQESLANSRQSPGVKDPKTGQVINNVSYESSAFDGVKLGGVRLDLDTICGKSNERCAHDSNNKLILDSSGNYTFIGDAEFPDLSKLLSDETMVGKMAGLTGGIQGGPGGWYINKLVIPYSIGSISDMIIEEFAGPHDYIGGQILGWYGNDGNTTRDRHTFENIASDITTDVAIPVAAPFALANIFTYDMLQMLNLLVK